ncbi:YegS/Rv2252/BmrU family lipid kinase [Oscillospiraceae bacterium MB08-C2-2]|nr:YegS/Rv2252/BmrU family lipid kinase [Oscillospiraceae bacterium MB08-C2-2]
MADRKKLFFIFNPKAGKMELAKNLYPVINCFVEAGFDVTVRPTQSPLDAFESAKERAGEFDYLVCSGGDGTFSQVVSGLMHCQKRPVLGYIPAGTTNDFAASLGLPKDIEQAARCIVSGRKTAVDVGRFNDDYFSYVAAFGIFTDVPYDTPQELKNLFGHAAYVMEGIKRLTNMRTYRCVLEQNGQQVERDYLLGIISNSISLGGFQGLSSERVQLNDGEFEALFVAQPQNLNDLNLIVQSFLRKEKLSDCLQFFRTSRVEIELCDEIHWTLDGEYGGSPEHVVIQNMREAVEIMVPDDSTEVFGGLKPAND